MAHYFEELCVPFCFLEFEVLSENIDVLDQEISAVVVGGGDDQVLVIDLEMVLMTGERA